MDLFDRLNVSVSNELYDAVCYRYDDEITLNSRTLLEFLQLSMAIYNDEVAVRVSDAKSPNQMTSTLTTKISQLENMVRKVNDSSRFKIKLQHILEQIINENNYNNLSKLFKTFLDLYKLYQTEESELDDLFKEIVTLDQTLKETLPASSKENLSSMGSQQSYIPPPPPPLPQEETIPSTFEQLSNIPLPPNPPPPPPMPEPTPTPPSLPQLISTPNAPPLPPPLPISNTSSSPPQAPPQTHTPAAPSLDFDSELRAALKRKATKTVSPETIEQTVKKPTNEVHRNLKTSDSLLDILQRRMAVEMTSSSSGSELIEEENDWLASPETVSKLKMHYKKLQKKITDFPMELPESITTMFTATSSILNKKQITSDEAETLQNQFVKLESVIDEKLQI